MIITAISISLFFVAFNYTVYLAHTRKYGDVSDGRGNYELSWPTRLHKYINTPLYLVVIAHIFLQPLVFDPSKITVTLLAIGAIFGVIGSLLLVTSLHYLGRNFMPCFSGVLPEERVKSGPYRYISHPIYAANVLQLISLSLMIPGPLVYLVFGLMLWIYYFTIRDENRSLDEHFSS